MFASMVLSISLMSGVQVIKATALVDGELKATDGIVLSDTDTNGKIDKVQISINYAVATADTIDHVTDESATIGKFTIVDTGTAASVEILSMEFVSGDGTVAVFKLDLNEDNVSEDISATALDVTYDGSGSDLKITSGTVAGSDFESVVVVSFSNVTEDDEDEDIDLPDCAVKKQKQPNSNSGVTLYRVSDDPRVYIVKDNKRRWVKTAREFERNGYNWDEIQEISAELLEEFPEAEALMTELLRAVDSHKVYIIENGKRRWIKTAREFNATGYKWKDIKDVSPEVLASYQNEVSSGLLRATGSHKVYKIENGKKRWIKTAGEFNAAGHRWEDVENVDSETLDGYSDLE